MEQSLTVRSDAIYEGYPNVSHFIVGVQSSKPLAEDALSESQSKQKSIIEELKRHGYKEEAIAILELHLTGGGETLAPLGPRAGFTVTVRLSAQAKDFPCESPEAVMKHFASLADVMARHGVDMWGKPDPTTFMSGGSCVRFSFEDFESIEAVLVTQAISNAKAKADQIANGVGKRVTDLITVDAVYSDFEVKGDARFGISRPERLTAGGALDAVKGPILAGYWRVVCKLSISATYGWAQNNS